ncbi:unnamed protein product [Dovyalis caffra]|uniref:Uncharacterized protein n=1 Tax=Dovyalis caffra TaxID=77055 RepID=A0AAV1QQH9_9ROSI|nr:unnamed protein product [Dovyalis caffra]
MNKMVTNRGVLPKDRFIRLSFLVVRMQVEKSQPRTPKSAQLPKVQLESKPLLESEIVPKSNLNVVRVNGCPIFDVARYVLNGLRLIRSLLP